GMTLLTRPVRSPPPVRSALVAAIRVIPGLAGTLPSWEVARRRQNAAQIATRHATSGIVVDRALALARHEAVVADSPAVLEDEPRLGTHRPCERGPAAAVVAVGVVVRIVEHDDAKAHARVRVGVPDRPRRIGVAVVAQEPGIVIVLLHVVRRDVVIPSAVAGGDDALRQVG